MLAPCPSCHRHVRLDDGACPFCQSDLARVALPAAPTGPRLRGLGRAAIFALGATLGGATLSGCPLYGGPPEPFPDGSVERHEPDSGSPEHDAGEPGDAG